MGIDQQENDNPSPRDEKHQGNAFGDPHSQPTVDDNATPHEAPAKQFPPPQGDDKEHRENERALVRWTKVVALLTGGLIFVGAVTGIIFYRQLNVMQGQLDAMERDQEPYLSPTDDIGHPIFTANPNSEGRVQWNVKYINLGKGIARNVVIDTFMSLAFGPFKRSDPTMRPEPVRSEEIPAGRTKLFTISSKPVVSQSEYDQLKTMELAVAILIEFTYSDLIGKPYHTVVCYAPYSNGAVANLVSADCQKRKEN